MFLAAAPNVRAFVPPALVGGYETEVSDTLEAVAFMASVVPVGYARGPVDEATEYDGAITLVGRHNGETMRGLPFWEVRRQEDWP